MEHIVCKVTPESFEERGLGNTKKHFKSRKDAPDGVFTTFEEACAFASQQAAAFPQQQFAVFSPVRIFETTKPKIITKVWIDGELLVEKKDSE